MISDYICKISNDNFLVWLQNSNKYIVVDSKLLKLINDKPKFSESIFLNKISQSLNINLSKSKDIYNEINKLLLEFNQPTPVAHKPIYQKLIPCDIICFYKFNNVNVKVCFDSEQSKRLIDPKFKHLTSLKTDNYNVQFSVFKNQGKRRFGVYKKRKYKVTDIELDIDKLEVLGKKTYNFHEKVDTKKKKTLKKSKNDNVMANLKFSKWFK